MDSVRVYRKEASKLEHVMYGLYAVYFWFK